MSIESESKIQTILLIFYRYPEDKGLYRVNFVTEEVSVQEYKERQEQLKNEESLSHWNYGATYERAGIYNPAWKTTPPPDGNTIQKY